MCDGCGTTLDLFSRLGGWSVCFDCTKLRHKAAVNRGRCACRSKKHAKECSTGSRRWLSCLRCLGTIKQLPDAVRERAPMFVLI